MKILVFSTVFYPSIGGLENHTLLLIKKFIERSHEVKVITYQKQLKPFRQFEVYYRPDIITSIKLFSWCTTYYMPNISLKGVWLLMFNPKKTWVISYNDFSYYYQRNFIKVLKTLVTRFATKNIAVSNSVAVYIHHNTVVVRNCYDDQLFKPYKDEKPCFDFVFLGRMVSQKGIDLLIKACAEIKYPFKLAIIGDGPEKEKLLKLTTKLGLNDSIIFTGILTGEKLARYINTCRVMVIPSLQGEGFGMVALEGLACGCKIIAANAGGLVEAIGNYGTLFNMGDQKALTRLMESELINNGEIKKDYVGLNEYLELHSSEIVANNYLEFFT